jgi:hypothetical protein
LTQPPQRPSVRLPATMSHYRLDRLLGAGGMGEVYLAVDRRDQQQVVVKLLHPHLENQPGFRERFEREAHVAALLRSPYAVHLLDFGFANGRYYLVMDYAAGQTLRDLLAYGPLEATRALRICAQVARALEEAQARGVVHRDIKPENIMVTPGDSVKVLDFGIARQAGASSLTMPGVFVGTATYAAPETALGEADTRSDIYSVGTTLFHLLTGRPPYDGTIGQVLTAHRTAPIPLDAVAPFGVEVTQIVGRCMAKDPAHRYQSASELASALEMAAGRQVVSRTLTPGEAATRLDRPAGAGQYGSGIQMELRNTAARGRVATYELVLRNPGATPTELRMAAEDPAHRTTISLPALVSIPPGGSISVPVQVKPRRLRFWGPSEAVPFTVSGNSGNGPPVGAGSIFRDQPFGRVPLLAAAAVAGLVGAAGIAFALSSGGDDDTPIAPVASPSAVTRTPTATRTPTSSPTDSATATGTPTRTPTATRTATTAPTATPPPPTATQPPPTATPTSPPVASPRMDTVTLCSDDTGVCISSGQALNYANGGCYPSRITSNVNFYNLTLPTDVAVRWSLNGAKFRDDSYTENNDSTGSSYAYITNTGYSLEPGTYFIEWGIVGGQPLASGTFYLNCN